MYLSSYIKMCTFLLIHLSLSMYLYVYLFSYIKMCTFLSYLSIYPPIHPSALTTLQPQQSWSILEQGGQPDLLASHRWMSLQILAWGLDAVWWPWHTPRGQEEHAKHGFHVTCHSVTSHCNGQFTPKMKANAEPRLLSSLVWIDSGVMVSQHRLEPLFHEIRCNVMASFMEFMIICCS